MECNYLLDLCLYQQCSVCDYVSVEFSLKLRGKNNRCDGSVPVVICPSDFPFKREEKGALFFFLNVFLLSFFFVSNGRSMICIGLVLWINCNSRGRQNIAASPASLLLKSTPQASSPLLTLLYPITTVNHLFELIDSYLDLIVWFFLSSDFAVCIQLRWCSFVRVFDDVFRYFSLVWHGLGSYRALINYNVD